MELACFGGGGELETVRLQNFSQYQNNFINLMLSNVTRYQVLTLLVLMPDENHDSLLMPQFRGFSYH